MMRKQSITERWLSFLTLLFDPIVIFLVLVSGGLFIFSLGQSDKEIITLMTILLSVSTGLLGSAVSKKWEELTEEKVIIARGGSAVRSLNLLLSHVNRHHRKAREYLSGCELEPKEKEALKIARIYLHELADSSVGLMEEVLGSIENWTDIIPEAKIETQVGIISDLTDEIADHETELKTVNERLKSTENKSQEQIAGLNSEKNKIEKELAKVKRELQMKELEFRPTLSSGSVLSSDSESYIGFGSPLFTMGNYKLCPKCLQVTRITDPNNARCQNCGNKL